MSRPIYLDYNATTPLDPVVIAAMLPFLDTEFGNPSSSHSFGNAPKRAVELARRQAAGLLNCRPEEVIFTSGGTESNNHAIIGMASLLAQKGRHIITSAIEHPAVLEVCRFLETYGFQTTYLTVDGDGLIDPVDVENALTPATVLITIMHANNEVGTIQPIAEIAAIARKHGVVMHTDAAQSCGKIDTDVERLGVDLLSVAGHKLYAPKGVGILYVRSPLAPLPFCHGAGQESGRRAGTENIPGIVGLGRACELAGLKPESACRHLQRLRDRLHDTLSRGLAGVRLNGHRQARLPNTLSLSFAGITAERLLAEIGLQVAASAGAACHAGTVTISHVLKAMAVPETLATGTVRFSVGRMTTADEIDAAAAVVIRAVQTLRTVPDRRPAAGP